MFVKSLRRILKRLGFEVTVDNQGTIYTGYGKIMSSLTRATQDLLEQSDIMLVEKSLDIVHGAVVTHRDLSYFIIGIEDNASVGNKLRLRRINAVATILKEIPGDEEDLGNEEIFTSTAINIPVFIQVINNRGMVEDIGMTPDTYTVVLIQSDIDVDQGYRITVNYSTPIYYRVVGVDRTSYINMIQLTVEIDTSRG